jgi:hypothetical protein
MPCADKSSFKTVYDVNFWLLFYIFSLVRRLKHAKKSAVEEKEEHALKLEKQAIFDSVMNPPGVFPGGNFVTHKRPRKVSIKYVG